MWINPSTDSGYVSEIGRTQTTADSRGTAGARLRIRLVVHRKWIGDTIRWESGLIEAPKTPELSIEFRESFVRAYPWQGTGLHLEIQEAFRNYPGENGLFGGAPSIADKTVD